MEISIVYGFPVLLIILSLVLGGLGFIKNVQGNKEAFQMHVIASALSCIAGVFIIYRLWN